MTDVLPSLEDAALALRRVVGDPRVTQPRKNDRFEPAVHDQLDDRRAASACITRGARESGDDEKDPAGVPKR